MAEQSIDVQNVMFMLNSLKILLECGETEHAVQLIDDFSKELESGSWNESEKTP